MQFAQKTNLLKSFNSLSNMCFFYECFQLHKTFVHVYTHTKSLFKHVRELNRIYSWQKKFWVAQIQKQIVKILQG